MRLRYFSCPGSRALTILICFLAGSASAQPWKQVKWGKDGQSIYEANGASIVTYNAKDGRQSVKIPSSLLTPTGQSR